MYTTANLFSVLIGATLLVLGFLAPGYGADPFELPAPRQKPIVDDWPNGFEKLRLIEIPQRIVAAAFSPDGKLLVVSDGAGKELQFLDAATGKLQRSVAFEGMPANGLKFTPDGKFLIIRRAEFSAMLNRRGAAVWGMDEMKVLWSIVGRVGGPASEESPLDDSPTGRYLAAGEENGRVHLWDFQEAKVAHVLEGHDQVTDVVFSADEKRVLSSSYEKVILWETATGRRLAEKQFDKPPFRVGFAPSDAAIALVPGTTTPYDRFRIGSDYSATMEESKIKPHRDHISAYFDGLWLVRIAGDWFWPDHNDVVSPDRERALILWGGPCVGVLAIVPRDSHQWIALAGIPFELWQHGFTRDGRWAYAMITQDTTKRHNERLFSLAFWDAKTGKPAGRVQPPGGVAGVKFSVDGRHVLMQSETRAWLWRDIELPLY